MTTDSFDPLDDDQQEKHAISSNETASLDEPGQLTESGTVEPEGDEEPPQEDAREETPRDDETDSQEHDSAAFPSAHDRQIRLERILQQPPTEHRDLRASIRELFSPPPAFGENAPQRQPLPAETNVAEPPPLSSPFDGSAPPEMAPITIRRLPPQFDKRDGNSTKAGVERLQIEVEITVANAERISRIALEEAKAEFKKLASQAVQRLDEKFYEYRAQQRVLWGR